MTQICELAIHIAQGINIKIDVHQFWYDQITCRGILSSEN
ncbi:hypothetical protein HMPREF0454_00668 [Hafnia alvei ATCC 51873]|uniref:Uncharacterized protein n=1 Tax=Hafnia alvei ATCC 51873 TaxID=1002364 RepID=G9Y256_HAFAL|nr:hypothetical protein HMPREF0454_00668 [Hafnia alvei ATCC 51873]